MGAVGGLLGLSGGVNGTGIAAPTQAAIAPGTTPEQLQTAYGQNQNSLQSQQALLQALQAQGGLGNQSNVYNQLQGVANGTGPNRAQAMLNQSTGNNVANQAALMAGQRGAGANAGLIARQAGQQGAGIQQNAAGQAATMQANQQLGALGQLGNMANQQVANQIGATTTNTQANQSEQQMLQNAIAQSNNANIASQSNQNNINGQLSATQMGGQQKAIGGIFQGAGMAAGLAEGGEVQKMASGGTVGPQSSFGQFLSGWNTGSEAPNQLNIGQSGSAVDSGNSFDMKHGAPGAGSTPYTDANYTMPEMGSQFSTAAPGLGVEGVSAPAAAGPGLGLDISSLSSAAPMAAALAQGGSVGSKLKSGGGVPGKAKVSGNSYANDTVKALLSPGEVVIPRNVMGSKDPIGGAAKFVAAVLAKKRAGGE